MLEITLKQLEVFAQVAACSSFSEAAAQLYLSQPAVSSQIAALEAKLGITLLERGSRKKVVLTARGHEIYLQCNSILQQCRQLETACETGMTELRIGASTMPTEYLLPPIMAGFRAENPQSSFILYKSNSAGVHEMLRRGDIQLGLVGTVLDRRNYVYRKIYSDTLILVAPNTAEYRALQKSGIRGKQLLTRPLIVRTDGSGTQVAVDRYFSETGVPTQSIHVVARMDSSEAVLQSVAQRLGVAVVSEPVARRHLEEGKLLGFALEDTPVTRELYLIAPKRIHPGAMAQRFIEYAITYAKAHL